MRKEMLICDRCGQEIEGNPVHIAVMEVDRTSNEILEPLNVIAEVVEGSDYCKECAGEVLSLLKNQAREEKQEKKERSSKYNWKKVWEMHQAGCNPKQIAEAVNGNVSTIIVTIPKIRKDPKKYGCN